uniref:Uncharacterized protein n=1 Tax=Entomoneis paludosa TaxID=265537 RepID=A0A7S2YDL8_9STRA
MFTRSISRSIAAQKTAESIRLGVRPKISRQWPNSTKSRCFSETTSTPSTIASKKVPKHEQQEALHKDVVEMMGRKPVSSQPLDPPKMPVEPPKGVWGVIQGDEKRRSKFYQGLLNSFFAFTVVVFSAQTFKAGAERRNVQQHLDKTRVAADERLESLQMVFSDHVVNSLSEKLAEEAIRISEKNAEGGSGWFGSKQTPLAASDEEELKKKFGKIMRKELYRHIGEETFVEPALKKAFEARLKIEADEDIERDVSAVQTEGTIIIPDEVKKQVFTM